MKYSFPDLGFFNIENVPLVLFSLGIASGILILSSLARLRWFSQNKQIPPLEYRCRITAVLSILLIACGICFPFIAGEIIRGTSPYRLGEGFRGTLLYRLGGGFWFLGFFGFELSLFILLFHCFPPKKWKQKQLLNNFLAGIAFFLVPFISFFLPRGIFFWASSFFVYLLLEHRIFGEAKPPRTEIPLRSQEMNRDGSAEEPESFSEIANSPFLAEPYAAPLSKDFMDLEIEEAEELSELTEEALPAESGRLTTQEWSDGREEGTTVSLASFIPREFLAILDKRSVEELKLGDHVEQEMSIFFSDIRQFTELSEDLTPRESFAFINSYLSRIVPEITKNGGFVDKYIGDAILALFPQANGAGMAVKTAIAIQEKIQEYNSHRAKCNYRPLSMGIGIHTGTLMVGVVGTEERMQSTVISDAVNLASRMESLTKAFGISLAISEETFKKLEDPGSYLYRFVGKVRVRGKSEPVSIFEIFDGIDEKIQRRKIQANRHFEQGMFLYYQKKFTEALNEFRKVMEFLPDDGASAFYIDACVAKIK